MNDMYKIIEELCGKRHVNITQMCRETGVPRGSITDLKMGRSESLSTKTLSKLAEYFQVPMDRFINAEAEEEPADVSELYSNIARLCEKQGISGYRLCKDVGIQPSVLSDLKAGRQTSLSARNADKIAAYFGVSVGYLLGVEEETPAVPGGLSEEDRRALEVVRGASPEELEILDRIRKASPDQQKAILTLLGREKG